MAGEKAEGEPMIDSRKVITTDNRDELVLSINEEEGPIHTTLIVYSRIGVEETYIELNKKQVKEMCEFIAEALNLDIKPKANPRCIWNEV